MMNTSITVNREISICVCEEVNGAGVKTRRNLDATAASMGFPSWRVAYYSSQFFIWANYGVCSESEQKL